MNTDQKNNITKASFNESVTKKSISTPIEWSNLGHVEVIRRWSQELNEAVEKKFDLDAWSLVGHAIIIVHDDVDDCRNIIERVAYDLALEFVNFDDMTILKNLSSEDVFVEFDKPTLVYLEPGLWMQNLDDVDGHKDEIISSIQKNICTLVENFNPECPVIYATSTAELSCLSPEFRKVGLFDRRFELIKPTIEEIAESFLEALGKDICGESLNAHLNKIGKLLELDFDNKRRKELVLLKLKRIAKRNNRKVEFADLLDISLQGTGEFDAYPVQSEESLRLTAIHEAGHATIAIIDSEGENMPEFVSIIESKTYNGVVADSLSYHYKKNNRKSYADVRHQIRVNLAGRVAEHLMLGSEHVRVSSAKDDLEKATNICFEMFATCGVSDDMESFNGASANLNIELERNSPSNLFKLETMVQQYLKKQYEIVYEMLNKNKNILDMIVDQLMKNKVLDQRDLFYIVSLLKS